MNNDKLPDLPSQRQTHVMVGKTPVTCEGFGADQMRAYGAACHALGRGAAVREYIELGAFKQPEAEAVPAKVASVDTSFLHGLSSNEKFDVMSGKTPGATIDSTDFWTAVNRAGSNGMFKSDLLELVMAWHNAKLAEVQKANRRAWEEGFNEQRQRAERSEADFKRIHSAYVAAENHNEVLISKLEAALAAQVPQAGQAPVAWRYQPKDGLKHPAYTERRAALAYDSNPVPLYAAPPAIPQQAVNKLFATAAQGCYFDENTLRSAKDWFARGYRYALAAPPASAAPVERADVPHYPV